MRMQRVKYTSYLPNFVGSTRHKTILRKENKPTMVKDEWKPNKFVVILLALAILMWARVLVIDFSFTIE